MGKRPCRMSKAQERRRDGLSERERSRSPPRAATTRKQLSAKMVPIELVLRCKMGKTRVVQPNKLYDLAKALHAKMDEPIGDILKQEDESWERILKQQDEELLAGNLQAWKQECKSAGPLPENRLIEHGVSHAINSYLTMQDGLTIENVSVEYVVELEEKDTAVPMQALCEGGYATFVKLCARLTPETEIAGRAVKGKPTILRTIVTVQGPTSLVEELEASALFANVPLGIDNLPSLPHFTGLLIKTNGEVSTVEGPFDLDKILPILECSFVQMLPCTVGTLAGEFEIWLNENGRYENALNEVATAKLGEQVFGGNLFGNVLVVRSGTIP